MAVAKSLRADDQAIAWQARLAGIAEEYLALQGGMGAIASEDFAKHAQRMSALEPAYELIEQRRRAVQELHDTNDLLANDEQDADLRELLVVEQEELSTQINVLDQQLTKALRPRDPLADYPAIIEIRAGAGGEEAALFVSDLQRLYLRYAEIRNWRIEIIDQSETDLGGCKEAIFVIRAKGQSGVFAALRHEAGVHRVQRVPQTESSGRLHTSTATVAVLPEIPQSEFEIAEKDLRIETFRARGAGGQHVNTTDSAVRIVHIPSGVTVQCQDEKSQHRNKERAMVVLRSRLFAIQEQQRQAAESASRRSQIGTGDRSERIRTYNFPQNRISDHRVNLTIRRLDAIMAGELDILFEPLHELLQQQSMLAQAE